jgi:hypothetical protein
MRGQSSRAHTTVRRGWRGARLLVYALLVYALLGYSVTRLLGYSVTRLLGYSSTLYSVTRPDARFWTTRAEPTSSGDTPQSVKNGRWNVATDSRQKTRFSAAVIDLTVARVWMPAHVAARSDAETAPLDFWVYQLEMSRFYADYGVKELGEALTKSPAAILGLVAANVKRNCAVLARLRSRK